MSKPAQKCENNAILMQKNTLKLFIAFKISYFWCFSIWENLVFLDFLQRKFYNIYSWGTFFRTSFSCYAREVIGLSDNFPIQQ